MDLQPIPLPTVNDQKALNDLVFAINDRLTKVSTDDVGTGATLAGALDVVGGLANDQQLGEGVYFEVSTPQACTLTGFSGRALCDVAFRFGPSGPDATRMYLQGLYNPEQPVSTFAVVGGTNQYQGASGTGFRTPIDGRNASWEVDLN